MTPATVHEEAATDEVAALASALTQLPHGPVRTDDDEDDGPFVVEGPFVVDGPAADEQDIARLLPRQRDEFTCRRCFLVAHVSRRARPGDDCCLDCA